MRLKAKNFLRGVLPRTPPGLCPVPRWGSAPDPLFASGVYQRTLHRYIDRVAEYTMPAAATVAATVFAAATVLLKFYRACIGRRGA